MVLYPSGSLPSCGACHARDTHRLVLWVQSMVRDDGERTLLLDLDKAIQKVDDTDKAVATQLTSVYHNLLRRWADV